VITWRHGAHYLARVIREGAGPVKFPFASVDLSCRVLRERVARDFSRNRILPIASDGPRRHRRRVAVVAGSASRALPSRWSDAEPASTPRHRMRRSGPGRVRSPSRLPSQPCRFPRRHLHISQPRGPHVGRVATQHLLHRSNEVGPVRDARGVRHEAWVLGQEGNLQDGGKPTKLRVVAATYCEVTVLAAQRLIWRDAGMLVAHSLRWAAGGEIRRCLVREGTEQAGQEVDLDPLALPRARPTLAGTAHCADGPALSPNDLINVFARSRHAPL